MKKKTIMACFLIAGSGAFAQEVVSSQGDSYSTANGNIDFTIGEVVISTGTDGTNDITQGFHQTNWNYVGLEDNLPELDIGVYPNPSSDILHIRSSSFEGLKLSMIDAQGRIVIEQALVGELTSIQVSEFTPGNYNLIIYSNGEKLKDFRLIKQQ